MRIAVVGATGTIGRPIAELIEGFGHEVRRLSRRSESFPVDLSTGAGLDAALADVDVVVHAANSPTFGRAAPVLIDGSRRLLAASAAHHVCVSIVGIEQVPIGYYRTKLAQERLVTDSARAFTIVRATQFHELVSGGLRRLARLRVALRSNVRLQPVAADDAAAAVAEVAVGPARNGIVTVAGPQVLTLTQMRAGPGIPLTVPLPPRLGRPLRAGALTLADPDIRGARTYAQWLSEH